MTLMTERLTFQFRMRDLLWAVSLFGVALGLGLTFRRGAATANAESVIPIFLEYIAAGACFGAGVGCLFRKPKLGAIWGFAASVLLMCMMLRIATL